MIHFHKIYPGTDKEPPLCMLAISRIGAFLWVGKWPWPIWFQRWTEVMPPSHELGKFWPSVFRRDDWLQKTKGNQ